MREEDFMIIDADSPYTNADLQSKEYFKRDILKEYKSIEKEDFSEVYESNEYIPLGKAVLIRKMLSFILYKYEGRMKTEFLERANKNYKVIDNLLNSIEENGYNFVQNQGQENNLILTKRTKYGFTKRYRHGRIYCSMTSITQLSREFRYLLFNKLYYDIDIVNAHPTILLNFAKKHDISVNTLEKLVENRQEFYSNVKSEYENINAKYAENLNVKRLSLAVINSHRNDYKSLSLFNLSKDLRHIRDKLKETVYVEGSSFKRAIDLRMIEEKTSDEDKLINKIQSLYCFDKETETIIALKNEIEENTGHIDSIVPFFDGLFILKDDLVYDSNTSSNVLKYDLNSIIDIFNSKSSLKVAMKPIESDYKLITEQSVKIFENLLNTVSNIKQSELEDIFVKIDSRPEKTFKNILMTHFEKDETGEKYKEVTLSYECLLELRRDSQLLLNKLIDLYYDPQNPIVKNDIFSEESEKKSS